MLTKYEEANAGTLEYCPKCGSQFPNKMNFCAYCGYQIRPQTQSVVRRMGLSNPKGNVASYVPTRPTRPSQITVAALLLYALGIFGLVVGLGLFVGGAIMGLIPLDGSLIGLPVGLLGTLVIFLSILYIRGGTDLWHLKKIGGKLTLVLTTLSSTLMLCLVLLTSYMSGGRPSQAFTSFPLIVAFWVVVIINSILVIMIRMGWKSLSLL